MARTSVLDRDIEKVLISQEEIEKITDRIADEIDRDYKDSKRLLLLCILKGSVVFMGDLMKKVSLPVEIDFMKVSSYSPSQLSGGQKQRVAIAGIIAMQPKCIILDEPTAMLDPHGRKEVMATIKRMNREQGVTIVLITHYMDEAAQAERVVVMDKGRVVLDNTPPKVFSQVEFLKGIGLDVPQVTELAWELRRAGCDIPEDIITEDECVEALAKLFGGKAQQHIGGV